MIRVEKLIREFCPNGVEYREFGRVCKYIRGITYGKEQEAKPGDKDTWRVPRANNITLETNTLNFNNIKEVVSSVKVKKEQQLNQGDILVCAGSGSKTHIGK